MVNTRGKKMVPKAGAKDKLEFDTPVTSAEPTPAKVVKKKAVKPKEKAAPASATSSKPAKETPPEKEPVAEASSATPSQEEYAEDDTTVGGTQEKEEVATEPAQEPVKIASKKVKKPARVPTPPPSEEVVEEEENEKEEGDDEALDDYVNELDEEKAHPADEQIQEERPPADSQQDETEEEVSEHQEQQQQQSEPSQAQTLEDEPLEDSPPKQRVGKAMAMKVGAKLAGEPSSKKRKATESTLHHEPKKGIGVGSLTLSKPGSGPPPVRGIINSKGVHAESLVALGIEQEEEYEDAVTVVPDSAERVKAKWAEVGDGSTYQSGTTKGYCLNNEALRFFHRVLAYSFFGRKDSSNSITNQELFILWCMVKKIKINFGYVAIAHFREIKTHPKHRISYAQLITQIAVRSRLLDLSTTDLTSLPMEFFDIACLKRMKDVVDDEEGKPVFFVPRIDPSSLLMIAGTSRKPPVGRVQQGEHPVTVILKKLEGLENAQFQTEEKLDRIETALKAYFKHDSAASVLPIYRKLISARLRIWVFSGDTDAVITVMETRFSLSNLNLKIKTPWYSWSAGGQIGGWTEVYDGLIFATVRGAGHDVPLFQSLRAFKLFQTFLSGKNLPKSH
ncbi:alpha/beta-Hydrolases superfamily protein [Perilla frutescens var. hirtella]|uniref:Alpha/beta-Hydrolases superfamily protein n=1 Tax=Perilla frutescens var. hirtella TaxID=608512 RepID=A0AAD4IVI5_PERFH|nr:alpha/beta-Hydrolases superfamily protein [Perilla frutescens var. hirtella]